MFFYLIFFFGALPLVHYSNENTLNSPHMLISFNHSEKNWSVDLSRFYDITLPIKRDGNVNCYYLDDPEFTYFSSPAFTGSLAKGGSVNCEKISLYPHASGTHTECALHVLPVDFDMRTLKFPALQLCQLITVSPESTGPDKVITLNSIGQLSNDLQLEAIVVRTLPNEENKQSFNYSDTNPVYFDPMVLTELRTLGFKHIITDLPSIDKESDEGRLAAHKNWFSENGVASPDRSITELVFINNHISDGIYVLGMQVPSLATDAVPSRILLYPLK